jgi:hypothetical protein
MQVVVHLRTVDPSDAYCGDRIADDGRGGKRSVQCSVFRWRRWRDEALGTGKENFIGVGVGIGIGIGIGIDKTNGKSTPGQGKEKLKAEMLKR